MGFLGSVIISFAFSMFKQRQVNLFDKYFVFLPLEILLIYICGNSYTLFSSIISFTQNSVNLFNMKNSSVNITICCLLACQAACSRDFLIGDYCKCILSVFHCYHRPCHRAGAKFNHIDLTKMYNSGISSEHNIFI